MHLVNVECFFYVIFQCMACAILFECNSDNHKTFECCPDYYKVNGNCTECPAGTFGLNCSSICPKNFYGQFCQKKCFCRHQYCHPVNGCNINNFTTTGDNFPCIQNYYILDGNCTECPNGTFGVNCNKTCPNNYFGRLCKIPCNCSDGQFCDSVKGCIPNNNDTDNGKMIDTGLTTVATEVTTVVTEITTIATEISKECPDGISGVNCTKTCPMNCTINQFCDMVDGCLQTNRDTDDENSVTSTTATRQSTSKWKDISFALLGAVFVVFVVAGVFYLRSRLRRFKKHWSFSNTEEDHGDASLAEQNIEVANIVSPTHSTQGHASEERREVLSYVYDDLRLSQMMDRNTFSGTDFNHFAACSEDTLNGETFGTYYESVSKRHYINSYTETSSEEESANNYEHFRMPTEYSILSLKRNIDPSVTELYDQRERGNDGAYDVIVGQFHNASERSENSQSESESETDLPLTHIQD